MVRKRTKSSTLKPPSISTARDSDVNSFRMRSIARASMMSKFKISRQGKKLQISDDPRTLLALPKDVPERTWAEILQKEENELLCFEIREEILDAALQIGYEHYMEKQNSFFTVHCAAAAILKIVDWHFYRHDPGEDPSNYPPCFIPKRLESWTPDEMPEPSVKDSWGLRELSVIEPAPEEPLPSFHLSDHSIDIEYVEPIPEEYWFPGKINLTTVYIARDGAKKRHVMDEDYTPSIPLADWGLFDRVSELRSDDAYDTSAHTIERILDHSSEVLQKITDYSSKDTIPPSTSRDKVLVVFQDPNHIRPDVELVGENSVWNFIEVAASSLSVTTASKIDIAESEVLQKITDYPGEEASATPESKHSSLKQTTPADGSLQGAGDSTVDRTEQTKRRSRTGKSKSSLTRPSMLRSRLPPLVAVSLSRVSIISDCRLRNLRMETQYEVSTEKLDSPVQQNIRKKI